MATYPNRPPFFAHKFCRLLTKSAIAQEVGADTCWLLTVIAHQEDAKRYSGAVTYYNMQLAALCGVESEARLIRIRQRAMDAGLLFYEPGAKRRPGVYWCIVSDALAAIADGPMDESTDEIHFQNGSESWDSLRIPLRSASESEGKAEGKRRESAPPSSLTLIPNPAPAAQARAQPAKRFIKPTLQEVTAYCLERKNDVDPERFHAFYEANGWVQGKGKPLKDWRAAIITWEKPDRERKNGTPGTGGTASLTRVQGESTAADFANIPVRRIT